MDFRDLRISFADDSTMLNVGGDTAVQTEPSSALLTSQNARFNWHNPSLLGQHPSGFTLDGR